MPAQTGIQSGAPLKQCRKFWIPAFAGMTVILWQQKHVVITKGNLGRLNFTCLRPDEIETVNGARVGGAAHAADRMQLVGIDAEILADFFSDVEAENLAQDDAAAKGFFLTETT
jgi:hypothetical protein